MADPPPPAAAADGDPPTGFVAEAADAIADMGHPQVGQGGSAAIGGGGGRGGGAGREGGAEEETGQGTSLIDATIQRMRLPK
jgi:hypothetical protein